MKCPTCGAWAEVLETRQADDGHRVNRWHLCANKHRFPTVEVHRPVFCSAKQRQRNFLHTVRRRVAIHGRRQEIKRRRAKGESQGSVARSMGISKSLISLLERGRL